MIKKIRLMLEYNTYCIWLYDENDEIIDNDNPPEWDDDETLTQAFMAVSDRYDPKSRVISTQIIRRQGAQVFPETAGLVR